MGHYPPPLDQLPKLGRPTLSRSGDEELNYLSLGIVPEHATDLIRMVNDEELFETEPQWYAQIHAWRALGQLRAPEAVEPLLDLIDINEDEDGFNDWIIEDLPEVLGHFGPGIIPAVWSRIEYRKGGFPISTFANVLVAIAKQHPDARPEVVQRLCRVLATAITNDPSLNGFIVSDLVDLKAVEAWPEIERAFATGNVDPSIVGDAAEVKFEMGLGPRPTRTYPPPASPHPSGQNAKQRFNERQRQKKLAKKQAKKRKGK